MLEDELSDEDLKWLKSCAGQGPQDEEWWKFNQLEQADNLFHSLWGDDFDKDELEEQQYIQKTGEHGYHAYLFSDLGIKNNYHIALFKLDEYERECFVSLDNDSKSFVTLGELALNLDLLMERNKGFYTGVWYIPKVPECFYKDKKYRDLYQFEENFLDDFLFPSLLKPTLFK